MLVIMMTLLLPALTPKEIREFFIPIVKLAKHLMKIHQTKQPKVMNEAPVVTVSES